MLQIRGQLALKLLKTFLITTTSEDRLRELAHLFINKNINHDCDTVINEFECKNGRLELV